MTGERAVEGHEVIDRLVEDLRAALGRLSEGAPQLAPRVAALALTLDEQLMAHLEAEEESLFPVLERIPGFVARVTRLRQEHEVLRLQSTGVRHLAARLAVGGAQAQEAKALFLPIADAFLDTLHGHSVAEDGDVLRDALAILGPDRFGLLTESLAAAERRRRPAAALLIDPS